MPLLMASQLRFHLISSRRLRGTTQYPEMAVHRSASLHFRNALGTEQTVTSHQADSVFSGISTFARLPYAPCLASEDIKYDVAFLGEQHRP